MAVNKNNKNNYSLNLLEALLCDEQWEEDVTNAACYAGMYAVKHNLDVDKIMKDVITYNIDKRIRNLILTDIPDYTKPIVWKRGTAKDTVFNVLDQLFLHFDYNKTFSLSRTDSITTITFKITDKVIRDYFCTLADVLIKEYSDNIKVSYKKIGNNIFELTFDVN